MRLYSECPVCNTTLSYSGVTGVPFCDKCDKSLLQIMESQMHYGEPGDCPRCRASVRPECVGCDHALTGVIQGAGWTACEACGRVQLAFAPIHGSVGSEDRLYRTSAPVWRSTVTVGDRVGRAIAWLVWAYRRFDVWLRDLYGASSPPSDDEVKDRLSGKR